MRCRRPRLFSAATASSQFCAVMRCDEYFLRMNWCATWWDLERAPSSGVDSGQLGGPANQPKLEAAAPVHSGLVISFASAEASAVALAL